MIEFNCHQCGRAFAVPDNFAGRRARCKSCGAEVTVPAARAYAAPKAASETVKLPMRSRRLLADAAQMRAAFENSELIIVKGIHGDPPDLYHVEYHIHSLDRDQNGKPAPKSIHLAEIQLTSDYPRLSPQCKMVTSVFHPNIDTSTICVGDHWTAGERLVDLVVRIGEMLAFQAYNIRSPLDGEAAMWADLNPQRLPTDSRVIRPANLE